MTLYWKISKADSTSLRNDQDLIKRVILKDFQYIAFMPAKYQLTILIICGCIDFYQSAQYS